MDQIQDDLLSLPMLFISLLLIIIIISRSIFNNGKSSSSSKHGVEVAPPGPWKLPIIGSIHHLGGDLPHRRFRQMSEIHGPLMYLQMGQVPTIVVSSAKMAQEIYKTNDHIFVNRPRSLAYDVLFYGPSDIIFSQYGDYWKLLRKIFTQQLLSATRVRSLQAMWEKEVKSLKKSLRVKAEEGSYVNLTEKLFVTVCGIVSESAFGRKHLEAVLTISKVFTIEPSRLTLAVTSMFPSWNWLHVISGVKRDYGHKHRKLDLALENIIFGQGDDDDDDDNGGQCLLSVLLKMKDHGDLTMNHVKALLLDVVIGATDAPPLVVEWALAEMLKNPRIMKRAQAEVREVVFRSDTKGHFIDESVIEKLEYLKAVVKETMRLHTPAPFVATRESTKRCVIDGYTIPSGTQVILNAWAIARDPNCWGNSSEEFLPERFLNSAIDYKGFNFEFIPFGGGKRVCPGVVYGVALVEMLLAHLVCYFDWELPNGANPKTLDMTEFMDTTLRRKHDLILVPISYNPAG